MKKLLVLLGITIPFVSIADTIGVDTGDDTTMVRNNLITYSIDYKQCLEKANGVTSEMNECISKEYDIQDKQLNLIYKTLRTKLTESEKTKLKKSQLVWIKEKDKKVDEIYKEYEGGTLAGVEAGLFLIDTTIQKANELQKQLNQLP